MNLLVSMTSSNIYAFDTSKYNDMLIKANQYDRENIHKLINIFPQYFINDADQNKDFLTMVYAVGNYFDNIRFKINNIFKLFTNDESIMLSKDLIDIKLGMYNLKADDFSLSEMNTKDGSIEYEFNQNSKM